MVKNSFGVNFNDLKCLQALQPQNYLFYAVEYHYVGDKGV